MCRVEYRMQTKPCMTCQTKHSLTLTLSLPCSWQHKTKLAGTRCASGETFPKTCMAETRHLLADARAHSLDTCLQSFFFHTPLYVSSSFRRSAQRQAEGQDLIQLRRRGQRGPRQGPRASKGCVADRLLHGSSCHRPPTSQPRTHRLCVPPATSLG